MESVYNVCEIILVVKSVVLQLEVQDSGIK